MDTSSQFPFSLDYTTQQKSGLDLSFTPSNVAVTDAPAQIEPYSNLPFMQNYSGNVIDKASQVDFNYDYSKVPTTYETGSFWSELASPVQDAGAFVWNTAEGTWDTVKTGIADAGTALSNVVDSAGTKLSDFTGGIFNILLLIFVVIIAAIWLLAKAGVIHDIAGVFR